MIDNLNMDEKLQKSVDDAWAGLQEAKIRMLSNGIDVAAIRLAKIRQAVNEFNKLANGSHSGEMGDYWLEACEILDKIEEVLDGKHDTEYTAENGTT